MASRSDLSAPSSADGTALSAHAPEATGAWMFRNRSWLPVPLALVLLVVRAGELERTWPWIGGLGCVALGIAVRMWAVRHIGVVSRTRATRLGPLVTTGPYALVRNPLYVGNFLLWTGCVLCSEVLWMLPIAWCMFAYQYGAIVRWEEQLLDSHRSASYDAYRLAVGRWYPRRGSLMGMPRREPSRHAWITVLFSERGTLLAALAMMLLLAVKALV